MATPDDIDQDELQGSNLAANDEHAEGGEPGEVDGAEGGEGGEGTDDGEVVITLGDEPAAPADGDEDDIDTTQLSPKAVEAFIRLRKKAQELKRQLKQAQEVAPVQKPQEIVLGPEPTMEDPDINFDTVIFKAKMKDWLNTSQKIEAQAKAKEEAKAAEQKAWMNRLHAVEKASARLKTKVKDYDDQAGPNFDSVFSDLQRGIILGGLEDPEVSAAIRYALGKNSKLANELAAIKDPVKFAIRIGKLEDKLKVEPRKAAPAPDRSVRGSGSYSGTTDRTLEALQAEADNTGDRSKVAKYLRDKNKRAA